MDEEDFFDNQIRTLLKGASFLVKCSVLESATTMCTSKLSNDHRFLLFDVQDKNVSIDPVELMLIESFQISHPGGSPSGYEFQMRYKDSCGEDQSLECQTADIMAKKYNHNWINALNRAMKLLQERKMQKH